MRKKEDLYRQAQWVRDRMTYSLSYIRERDPAAVAALERIPFETRAGLKDSLVYPPREWAERTKKKPPSRRRHDDDDGW